MLIYQKHIKKKYQDYHEFLSCHEIKLITSKFHQFSIGSWIKNIRQSNANFSWIKIRSKNHIKMVLIFCPFPMLIFIHQNYVKQSMSKICRFFAHLNQVEESKSKQHQFFTQQNYIKKYNISFWYMDVIPISNRGWFEVMHPLATENLLK